MAFEAQGTNSASFHKWEDDQEQAERLEAQIRAEHEEDFERRLKFLAEGRELGMDVDELETDMTDTMSGPSDDDEREVYWRVWNEMFKHVFPVIVRERNERRAARFAMRAAS